ncbi:hypothetical protein SAMN04488066_101370 [Halorubrum aquaticum]|uniref:Uncharacterized protein n=1 Tax=Halorubrum aquaticum TaxID=387340 RepID=A0A1I2Z9F3_9EURY|nr:hypothetical protein [Halorubrum aquaticum]SFH34492.1 hypothetical protein SAMN04488066_101370 [Halorubrum aquaticum]
MSSVERQIDVDLDTDENAASAVVEERRELNISELFNANGELRLWQDSAGWSGYIREIVDDETRYYAVNTRFDEDEWISKIRCGEQAVHDAIRQHIEDRHAGGVGNFVKRCSPP